MNALEMPVHGAFSVHLAPQTQTEPKMSYDDLLYPSSKKNLPEFNPVHFSEQHTRTFEVLVLFAIPSYVYSFLNEYCWFVFM